MVIPVNETYDLLLVFLQTSSKSGSDKKDAKDTKSSSKDSKETENSHSDVSYFFHSFCGYNHIRWC